MSLFRRALVAALCAPLFLVAPAAQAGIGDLLVAPTRVVLNGGRGTEIILTNIGQDAATYRVSVELRRMRADGMLDDVETPTEAEAAARDMIVYAPRRVTLIPDQPQTIRISARAPKGLPDGEYRVHMLFRAVPPPEPVKTGEEQEVKGIAFKLTPIYGVTIPVIVRLGNLEAQAAISNVRLTSDEGKPAVALDLSRSGSRSTFGEIRVIKAGIKDPVAIQRGVAVYTDVGTRTVTIPVQEEHASAATGPVTVQYVETFDDGRNVIAETQAVLR